MTNANNANGWTASRKGPNSRNKTSGLLLTRNAWSDSIHSKLPEEWYKIALFFYFFLLFFCKSHFLQNRHFIFLFTLFIFLGKIWHCKHRTEFLLCRPRSACLFFYCGNAKNRTFIGKPQRMSQIFCLKFTLLKSLPLASLVTLDVLKWTEATKDDFTLFKWQEPHFCGSKLPSRR